MRHSFAEFVIVAILIVVGVGQLLQALDMTRTPVGGVVLAGVLLRLAIAGVAVFAGTAVWRQRAVARRFVTLWAVGIMTLTVFEDVAAGYGRPGMTGRLLATLLGAALLAVVVLSVPPSSTSAR